MRRSLFRPALLLLLGLAAAPLPLLSRAPAATAAPAPGTDYAALIGDFPHPGSDGAKADQAILLWLQRTRTADQVRRAESELVPHLGLFSAVAGKDLEGGQFPATLALAAQADRDLRKVTGALKLHFGRPRPYAAMADLRPALPHEPTYSYPSGHSTWGMMEGSLLAALQPANRDALLERGRLVGYDRCLGGVHYPSDVDAGQRLGAAFIQAWLADPAHAEALARARAEW